MSANPTEPIAAEPKIVDLVTIHAVDLDRLWQQEADQWRDRLLWDVPVNSVALLRALKNGSVQGRAVTAGTELVAYSYYFIVEGNRGVISALVVAPSWHHTQVGQALLQAVVKAMHQDHVTRIECPAVSFDSSWQTSAFEHLGFQIYWRDFLRTQLSPSTPAPQDGELSRPRQQAEPWQVEPWGEPSRAADIEAAAVVMLAAYDGGVDAESCELYRSLGGCHTVLQNLLRQTVGGRFIPKASGWVRQDGQLIGFSLITEISDRQAHLAQIVVMPQYQGQGIGRLLLEYSCERLRHLGFNTFSLIVSQTNHRAVTLYKDMGFTSVLSYLTSTWDTSSAPT